MCFEAVALTLPIFFRVCLEFRYFSDSQILCEEELGMMPSISSENI